MAQLCFITYPSPITCDSCCTLLYYTSKASCSDTVLPSLVFVYSQTQSELPLTLTLDYCLCSLQWPLNLFWVILTDPIDPQKHTGTHRAVKLIWVLNSFGGWWVVKGFTPFRPDLGHMIDGDRLCTYSPWLPPEVWANQVEQKDQARMEWTS